MELFILYLWMKIDGIIHVCAIMALISGLILGMWSFFRLVLKNEVPKIGRWKLLLIPLFVICLSFSALMPSSKQLAGLVAGYYAMKVIDSPEVAKMVELARAHANQYMDEELRKIKDGVASKVPAVNGGK